MTSRAAFVGIKNVVKKFCRGNYMTNPNKGKWYRFNDTVVEEFEMTDANLEAECFGGKYKAKVYDNSKNQCARDTYIRIL